MVTTLFETLDKNKEDLLNTKYITNESEREERITIQKSKIELLEDLINYTETPEKLFETFADYIRKNTNTNYIHKVKDNEQKTLKYVYIGKAKDIKLTPSY